MAATVSPEAGDAAIEELSGGQAEDLWSEQDATPDDIDAALRRMLRERHAKDESLVPARVLNLVVLVDRDWKGEIANRLAKVGRYHASRTVLCAVEPGRTRIDARAAVSYGSPDDGDGVMHEEVEIDLGEAHLAHLDTIIDPVVVAELPTMLWSPHGHAEAVGSLHRMVDVMLIDSDDGSGSLDDFTHAAKMLDFAYVVDLAWLRTTPWRERLASSFDPPWRREMLRSLDRVEIQHRESSNTSALLLAGWLASRLGWKPEPLRETGRARLEGKLRGHRREIELVLEPSDQESPGLGGVTVSAGKVTLSLERAPGGLQACERRDGEERRWQILGHSRGEGGILGEGVRQAHLRDPTYGPALEAARKLLPQ
jgi:glucose-6-phosphate dehydrogenase assembly protein OpcA